MFLAIKNPSPVYPDILCSNPSEAVLLSAKDVERIMGPGFKASSTFWQRLGPGREQEEEACFYDKLRTLGNELFRSLCFSDAVRYYDLALQYASTEEEKAVTLSNKAAALLRMRCHTAALEISQLAVGLDPSNVKAVYRMGQALMRLGKFEEAVKELKTRILPSVIQENDAFKDMLGKAEGSLDRKTIPLTPKEYISLCKYSRGPFVKDIAMEMEGGTQKHVLQRMVDSLAEYVGPVEVKQCTNAGKGRGLFVTQDISPGQVVIISRAISVAQDMKGTRSSAGTNGWDEAVGLAVNYNTRAVLLTQVANQIIADPTAVGSLVYQLSAGENLGFLAEEDPRTSLVDMDRIRGILANGTFYCHRDDDDPTGDRTYTDMGLWFLPSFVNHSCSESNCVFEHYGDIFIVKATKKISKGDEIMRCYVRQQHWSFEKKQKHLNIFGITCTCKLCTFDLKEKDNAVRRRIIADDLDEMSPCREGMRLSDVQYQALLTCFELTKKLWNDHPIQGLFESAGINAMATYFIEGGNALESSKTGLGAPRYEQALKMMKLAFTMDEHGMGKIVSIVNILHCLLKLKNREDEVTQYLKTLKEELCLWFGSIEAIRLEEAGINFFTE